MKKIYIILVAAAFFSSCAKNLGDYNVDQKKATVVPGVTFISNAEKNFTDILTTPNVNSNVFRFYVQYWTSTEYLDEPRYNLTARPIPGSLWDAVYQKVIVNIKEGKKLINADALLNADVKANQVAQAEIMEVMAWSTLVNAFGNIPYSQALDITVVNPKYDDAATIYSDLLVRLDAALAQLKPAAAGLGTADIIYKGDVNAWVKFGNSLKLRLGLIIADKDPAKAKATIESAAPNVFKSAADNAIFKYLGSPPNNNPISTNANILLTKRKDFVGAKPFIDRLNALADPRRKGFFTTIGGNFVGGNYGYSNSFGNYSTMTDKIISLDFEAILLDYPETELALAEASARGFNVGGSAADHYNNGITASIIYWGGTATDAATYLARPDVAYATAIAGTTYKEVIGTQKWIALYNRGFESWTEWRRLDFPKLLPPTNATAPPGQSVPDGLIIPKRLIYPNGEQTLNGANYQAASAAIGGDAVSTKLWWDMF